MSSILNILPALAFLLILLSISAYIQRTSKENRQKDFAKESVSYTHLTLPTILRV